MTETPLSDSADAQDIGYELQPPRQYVESEQPETFANGSVFKFPKKKRVLTILLVGETGSGKTSFLSLLLNLFQGKGPFELEELHDPGAESGLDKTQSQTTEARSYGFTTADGVQFQIIDTPGLADTRGIEEDNKHRAKIYGAIKELVTRIDGIILVANGRIERLTATMRYTLETLATFFPRSIKNNIGILFTNVDVDGRGFNFKMTCLPSDLQTAKYWCLENPLSTYKDYLGRIRNLTESERKQSRRARRLEEDYEDTVRSLDNWLEWLDTREAIPTITIIELYHKSTEIESRLYGTTLSLENLSRLQKALNDITRELEAVEKKQSSLVEIQDREPPKIWELVETPDNNTICLSSSCYSNCHARCDLELSDPKDLGGWCKVFKTLGIPNRLIPFKSDISVECSECQHEASEHRNYKGLYEERESKVYQDIVQSLDDAKVSEEKLMGTMSRIEMEMKKIEESIEQSRCEIPRLVDEMNGLSLSPNYAGYIRSAIQLFELRKKHLESLADSDGELLVVDKGLVALKGHLDLIKEVAGNQLIHSRSKVLHHVLIQTDFHNNP
ncbi:hypothetical protein FRC11_014586 [Ceratobasidium sp. 423]|nr:hypothetical protein FRC11_014586 [Ceratobasidium sp. 423]